MTVIKATVRNRRIDVPAPNELPDGTEIVVTIGAPEADNAPLPPEEITRIISAMEQLESLDISDEEAADLDAWERRIDKHGKDHADVGLQEVFP